MATLNDFKIVNLKSRKMFDFLNVTIECDDVQKRRLGFYHLVLESITGERDVDSVKNMIIDTDYNKTVIGEAIDDLGMDAVNIVGDTDAEEASIQLFNFKFREKFNPQKHQEEGALSRSTKYLEYLLDNEQKFKTELPETKVKRSLLKIHRLLNSNTLCNIVLYVVSNEASGFSPGTNGYVELLERTYGMKVRTISLDDIMAFIVPSRGRKESKFVVGPNDFLIFEPDDLSTQRSYTIKMSLADLIRITSINDELCLKYNIEDDTCIKDAKLDYALLYDNVRGYLGETTYNKNIISTLENNHKEFFMLNNGLTFTAVRIDSTPINSHTRYMFHLKDFQIVNGGQTIRSIYNYLESNSTDSDIHNLRETYVLVRIFKISEDDELKNRIAEYTNSQNAISSSDLKSVDNVQIQIETYLKEEGILYIRKNGQVGEDGVEYLYRISKEKIAQLLYSASGYPDRASNQKKRLFQEYYEDIFKGDSFSLDKVVKLTHQYFEIENYYSTKDNYDYFELKNMYIIYLLYKYNMTIESAVEILEKVIEERDPDMRPSRLLLKNKFKLDLDKKKTMMSAV